MRDNAPSRRARSLLLALAAVAIGLFVPSFASAGILSATVEGGGTLAGSVEGVTGEVVCPPRCETFIPDGTTVEVTARPATGATFLGWGGACAAASGPVCTVLVSGDQALSARFTVPPPAPPAPPVLERRRLPLLGEVTVSGTLPACARTRLNPCEERFLGVARDGRLVLLRRVGLVQTVRALSPSGGAERTIARLGRSVTYETPRLSTDRRVVLWPTQAAQGAAGVVVPSGRRVAYPAWAAGSNPDQDADRAGGRLLVNVALPPTGVSEALVVGRPGVGPRRRIRTPRVTLGPRLSPDGRRVAYITKGHLVVRSITGSSTRTVTPASSGPADGRWFVGGIPPGKRVGWNVTALAWSPDGSRIAAIVEFLGADLSAVVVSLRPDGGDLRPLAPRSGATGLLDWLPDGDIAFDAKLARDDDSNDELAAIGFVDSASGSVSYLRRPGVLAGG